MVYGSFIGVTICVWEVTSGYKSGQTVLGGDSWVVIGVIVVDDGSMWVMMGMETILGDTRATRMVLGVAIVMEDGFGVTMVMDSG